MSPRPCIIDSCPKPAGVPGTARGYCSTHYHRWKRTGNPLTTLRDLWPDQGTVCSVDGCERPRWARRMCEMHLYRWRKHGDPGGAAPMAAPKVGACHITACSRPVRYGARQLCQAHYLRWWKYGDPLAGGTFQHAQAGCSIDGCDGAFYARAMCNQHWMQAVGSPRRRLRNRSATGECSGAQLNARIAYFGGRCWLCGEPYEEIDHVKPLSRGGSNWPSNLRPVCKSCNCRKRSRWFGPARLAEVA